MPGCSHHSSVKSVNSKQTPQNNVYVHNFWLKSVLIHCSHLEWYRLMVWVNDFMCKIWSHLYCSLFTHGFKCTLYIHIHYLCIFDANLVFQIAVLSCIIIFCKKYENVLVHVCNILLWITLIFSCSWQTFWSNITSNQKIHRSIRWSENAASLTSPLTLILLEPRD